MNFSKDDLGFLQQADTDLLLAVARGELDITELMRDELTGRGVTLTGEQVGVNEAFRLRFHG